MKQIRKLTSEDVQIKIKPIAEKSSPDSLDYGDDALTAQAKEKIRLAKKSGSDWAWCQVKVQVLWNGVKAADYIAQCSFTGEADYKKSGHYRPMLAKALSMLNDKVAKLHAATVSLETDVDETEAYTSEVDLDLEGDSPVGPIPTAVATA